MIHLSAGAATALEDERSGMQGVLEKHTKAQGQIAKEWAALKKKYYAELTTGVRFLEGAVRNVASASLQAAYREWSAEARELEAAQQAQEEAQRAMQRALLEANRSQLHT